MHRSSFLLPGLLLISTAVFGQTSSTDSQTLQALLAEVRHLRLDLQNITVATQRAQVLVYRLQAQQAAVARASQRLDDARSKVEDTHSHQKRLAAQIKQYEEMIQGHTENPAERKLIEEWLPRGKAELEALPNEEQERQAKQIECEEQLRTEQTKLRELQGLLDELDKSLEKSRPQPVSPH